MYAVCVPAMDSKHLSRKRNNKRGVPEAICSSPPWSKRWQLLVNLNKTNWHYDFWRGQFEMDCLCQGAAKDNLLWGLQGAVSASSQQRVIHFPAPLLFHRGGWRREGRTSLTGAAVLEIQGADLTHFSSVFRYLGHWLCSLSVLEEQ